jgi:hypothetical protein
MKNIYFALVLCLVISVIEKQVYGQGEVRETTPLLLPQGYSIGLLNSKGTSGIFNDVSNIGLMNPATIYLQRNYSVAFSYQFQTDIDEAYALDIGTKRVQNSLPQTLGGVVQYENLSFGIGFDQKYNGSIEFGPIQVTTVSNPDGTGQYYTPEFENTLQNYTVSAAYLFEEILIDSSSLAFGVKYILNRLYSYESIAAASAKATAFGSNLELGAYYEFIFNDEQSLGIGSSYTFSTNISDQIIYENSRTTIPGTIPGDSVYQIAAPEYELSLKIPSELSFDINFKAIKQLNLLGRINTIYWKDAVGNIKNQIEFSSSAAFSFNRSLEASLGIYYTSKEYIDDFFDIDDELYAIYLTAGVSFQLNIFNIDLALADSHLFSGDLWKQTIGKIGLGIQL